MTENTISDELKAYKDLRNYQQSDEWKKLDQELIDCVTAAEKQIMESKGDTKIVKSTHCVMWARQDLYSKFLDKITDDNGAYLKEMIVKEIDAILSQILYKVMDEMGVSLDNPIFSKTDLIRFDIKSFYYLKSLLENTIATLDPNKKGTKDSMNPYTEDYSNDLVDNPAPIEEVPA
jgi:hypothetical protein